jgi:L-methionine (R)-S-oxide reductase
MPVDFENLFKRSEAAAARDGSREERLLNVCRLLRREVPHYHWVGFYIVDSAAPRELVLGPFDGAPTEHTRIAFGKGICGQAAERGETVVASDVAKEENYLSCSPNVRSEIVVPVLAQGRLVGEVDIDSHVPNAFTPEDRAFLERLADLIAPLL